MAHDLFISYSHKDKATADAICARMESGGIRCWYAPRDIEPGANWASSIIDAIETTKVMVLIFTEHSNISDQVLREVSNAVSNGVPIVPFRLTAEEPIAGMQYYLSTVHWLDAMNADMQESLDDLYSLCSKLIDHEAETAGEKAAALAETKRLREEAEQKRREEEQRKKLEEEAQRKKKKLIIICAAAVVVIAAVLGIVFLSGSGDSNSDGSGQPASEESGGTPATGGLPSEKITDDITETYTSGNTQGNLQAGGLVATDGDWFYYQSNDKHRMYRMHSDGSEAEPLTDDPVKYISVYEGYVYYYNDGGNPGIYRMNTDGSDVTRLHNGNAEYVCIIDDRIYYRDAIEDLNLYSMDLNGGDVKKENDLGGMYNMTSDGEHVYYTDPNDGGYMYRAKMDGSDAACIVDHPVEGITIAGNLLYFNDNGTNKFSTYNIETGEITELLFDYLYYINVTEDGIYAYSGTDNMNLVCAQLDGNGSRILVKEPVTNVCVCGGRIVYVNDEDHKNYMVDLEGEHKTEL